MKCSIVFSTSTFYIYSKNTMNENNEEDFDGKTFSIQKKNYYINNAHSRKPINKSAVPCSLLRVQTHEG